jgi:hypothetical protein
MFFPWKKFDSFRVNYRLHFVTIKVLFWTLTASNFLEVKFESYKGFSQN